MLVGLHGVALDRLARLSAVPDYEDGVLVGVEEHAVDIGEEVLEFLTAHGLALGPVPDNEFMFGGDSGQVFGLVVGGETEVGVGLCLGTGSHQNLLAFGLEL